MAFIPPFVFLAHLGGSSSLIGFAFTNFADLILLKTIFLSVIVFILFSLMIVQVGS
jgi:hypothetical protein